MSHGLEHPLGQFGSPVLVVSPPSLPCTLSLLTSMATRGAGRPWLSKTKNISKLSTLCLAQTQNRTLHQLLGRKLTLPQAKPAYKSSILHPKLKAYLGIFAPKFLVFIYFGKTWYTFYSRSRRWEQMTQCSNSKILIKHPISIKSLAPM